MMHGRGFGARSIPFTINVLVKGELFMWPIFFFNIVNGFSGLALYSSYFFALFNVCNTTLPMITYLTFE
jgi:hypothetical protein